MFDRIVDAKSIKPKDSKETVRAFLTMIKKKIRPKRNWVDKGTEFAGQLAKLCKAEGVQIYSTMSDTTIAFAKRRIRSLKNIPYRYMEDYEYKYIHKLSQFVKTLKSTKNCSIDLLPKNVKNSYFFCFLYRKPLREYRKPKFRIAHRIGNSKFD